jgi:hypothetical protein
MIDYGKAEAIGYEKSNPGIYCMLTIYRRLRDQ